MGSGGEIDGARIAITPQEKPVSGLDVETATSSPWHAPASGGRRPARLID
jgi:hypothetical protein